MISPTEWQRERHIRRTLRALARQRVAMVLQPGNVFVVERAIPNDEDSLAALRTGHMRGWVEPMFDEAIPQGRVPLPGMPITFDQARPVYRLTDSGWAVIRRSLVESRVQQVGEVQVDLLLRPVEGLGAQFTLARLSIVMVGFPQRQHVSHSSVNRSLEYSVVNPRGC